MAGVWSSQDSVDTVSGPRAPVSVDVMRHSAMAARNHFRTFVASS
jgi:hypothetical protein